MYACVRVHNLHVLIKAFIAALVLVVMDFVDGPMHIIFKTLAINLASLLPGKLEYSQSKCTLILLITNYMG